MRRFEFLALVVVAASTSYGQGAMRGPVQGAIWEFKAVHGSETVTGQYRVYNKEVFKGKTKVGYITPTSPRETTLHISGFPKLNGTTHLHKIHKGQPIWEGVLERPDGSKWDIHIEIKD